MRRYNNHPGQPLTLKLLNNQRSLFPTPHQDIEYNNNNKIVRGKELENIAEYETRSIEVEQDLANEALSYIEKEYKNQDERFSSPRFSKALTILLSDIIYIAPELPNGADVNYSKIHSWIDELDIVKGGVTGLVFRSGLKTGRENIDNLLIIKTSKRGDDKTTVHEFTVGSLGTNRLRDIMPNFAYIYGFFNCSRPLVFSGSVLDWCQPGSPVSYVIYENIPGKTFFQYIQDEDNMLKIFGVYIMVIHAVYTAYLEIDFTHYDLHALNIIVNETPQKVGYSTPYGGILTIKSGRTPVIIDFDRSHFKSLDGLDYGYDYPDLGDVFNKSRFYYDIFKLTGHFLYACIYDGVRDSITSKFLFFFWMMKFFNPNLVKPEDAHVYVTSEMNNKHGLFTLPLGLGWDDANPILFFDFLRHNMKSYDNLYSDPLFYFE